jgi:hypothetical protein
MTRPHLVDARGVGPARGARWAEGVLDAVRSGELEWRLHRALAVV